MNKLFTFFMVIISAVAFGQAGGISISAAGTPPDPSAMLDVNAQNKGFLMPRIGRAQRDAISAPAAGLQIYDTTTNCFEFYTGSFWQSMICACSSPPAQIGSISGLTVYCAGQTGAVYSVEPVATATSYAWSVPSDATIVTGQGSTSIIVNFGSASGTISVFALNTCGNGISRSISVESQNSVAPNPGTMGGLSYAVNNQTGVGYSLVTVPHTAYYNWTVPSGATVASGQGTNSITVNFGSSSGNVCVTDSNGCGVSSTECMAVNVSGSCANSGTATYIYTGAPQTFNVPTCVSSVTVSVYGAQGGTGNDGPGGLGGYATGTLSVTPGGTLAVYVGNQPKNGTGGFNGGGNGAGGLGGGGASDIRMGGTNLTDRVIVGGGGGGATSTAGWTTAGGTGGGTNGGDGTSSNGPGHCGKGATQSAGGAAESAYGTGYPGAFGQGGNASPSNGYDPGGGGGYYGGGGGAAGGGGGGSGYIGGVSGGSMQNGVQSGNGQVVITW